MGKHGEKRDILVPVGILSTPRGIENACRAVFEVGLDLCMRKNPDGSRPKASGFAFDDRDTWLDRQRRCCVRDSNVAICDSTRRVSR